MYTKAISVITLLVTFLCTPALAFLEGPIPYSQEAIEKLSKGKLISPTYEPGMSQEEKVKVFSKSLRDYFKSAGYSFDKTVVKLEKDIKKDPKFFEENASAGVLFVIITQSCGVVVAVAATSKEIVTSKGLLNRVFPKDVADAIFYLGYERPMKEKELEEQRKKVEEEKKQKEAEKKEQEYKAKREAEQLAKKQAEDEYKQKRLKIKLEKLNGLQGHYENLQGEKKKKYGEIDIKVISADEINFSGYNTSSGRTCRVENKSAKLSYDDYKTEFEAIFKEDDCRFTFTFFKNEFNIDQGGRCSSFCEKGGGIIMLGNFNKISEQPNSTSQTDVTQQPATKESQTKEPSQPQQQPQQQQTDKVKNTDKVNPFEKVDKTLKGIFGR